MDIFFIYYYYYYYFFFFGGGGVSEVGGVVGRGDMTLLPQDRSFMIWPGGQGGTLCTIEEDLAQPACVSHLYIDDSIRSSELFSISA